MAKQGDRVDVAIYKVLFDSRLGKQISKTQEKEAGERQTRRKSGRTICESSQRNDLQRGVFADDHNKWSRLVYSLSR
ncbi:hypothetical protein PoB_007484500 [Plakobranchus ocellatus]|uniref:Uncharacterized protein n=1 Tax=Plakobranchus ocellatus TaxID=259542 RepID=A0AAV4DW04_9GAST|nr:hypothetical protein PoB_007484500 [Plakobranchus ocellatus]